MTTLTSPKGISSASVIDVPDTWSADWFRRFIRTQLSQVDVRNATQGAGIVINGTPTTAATISLSGTVNELFHQPYALITAPVGTGLDSYRILAAQVGVLALTDAGARGAATINVVPNGIGATQIRQSGGLSVVGNPGATSANVSDITAGAEGEVLHQASGSLVFSTIKLADTVNLGPSLTVSGLSTGQVLQASGSTSAAFAQLNFSNLLGQANLSQLPTLTAQTVLGNITAGSAVPTALSETQLTSMILAFSATLPGAVPASGGGTAAFLRADGNFAVPAYPVAANPATAKVGLAAVNGVAATFMRSDAAPPLDQTIVPTMTGLWTFQQALGAFSATGNPILKVVNTSATAQSPVDFFSNTSTLTGRIRNDSAGNMNYVSLLSGVHDFWVGGDSGVGVLSFGVASGKIQLIGHATTVTAPAAGGAGALPATPKGYATISINGTDQKFAFY